MSEALYKVIRRPAVPQLGAKVGTAYAVPPMPVTLYELRAIRDDPNHTAYVIPFGMSRGMITIRRAVPWKKVKGDEFWKVAEKHGRLAEGLRKAISISKQAAGIKGVVFVNGVPYPRKAWEQKKIAGKM